MTEVSYQQRRGEIEHYFDSTAVDAWKKLTSDAPVSHSRVRTCGTRPNARHVAKLVATES